MWFSRYASGQIDCGSCYISYTYSAHAVLSSSRCIPDDTSRPSTWWVKCAGRLTDGILSQLIDGFVLWVEWVVVYVRAGRRESREEISATRSSLCRSSGRWRRRCRTSDRTRRGTRWACTAGRRRWRCRAAWRAGREWRDSFHDDDRTMDRAVATACAWDWVTTGHRTAEWTRLERRRWTRSLTTSI